MCGSFPLREYQCEIVSNDQCRNDFVQFHQTYVLPKAKARALAELHVMNQRKCDDGRALMEEEVHTVRKYCFIGDSEAPSLSQRWGRKLSAFSPKT